MQRHRRIAGAIHDPPMAALPKPIGRALLVAAAFVVVACSWYPPLQDLANRQVDAGLERALVSFASARTLNALISVVQGTELSMQPLGVGVTLTLGQVLDPVNDLVEQLSSLMLVASVAFGVQKALLAVGAHWAVSALVSALVLAWAALSLRQRSPRWLTRALLVLLLIRFAIPVATLGSELVFQQLMARDYVENQKSLDTAAGELRRSVPQAPASADRNWLERMKDRLAAAVPDFKVDFDAVRASVEGLPERVVRLIVIFVMQTLVLPILLVWALYRIVLASLGPPAAGPTP